MKSFVVCQDKYGIQSEDVGYPPIGVLRLNMAFWAANDYLVYEKKVRGHIRDSSDSLLKLRIGFSLTGLLPSHCVY